MRQRERSDAGLTHLKPRILKKNAGIQFDDVEKTGRLVGVLLQDIADPKRDDSKDYNLTECREMNLPI